MPFRFQECGADCVKLQLSSLTAKFNKAALNRPYDSEHAWGVTYGAHKKHLEFSRDQVAELQQFAAEVDIPLTASAMDIVSVPLSLGLFSSPSTERVLRLSIIVLLILGRLLLIMWRAADSSKLWQEIADINVTVRELLSWHHLEESIAFLVANNRVSPELNLETYFA